MKKYGIWEFVLLGTSGNVIKCEITATSGKDAKTRVKSAYEGCEVLKMTRVEWLDGFSYAQMSAALLNAFPKHGHALTQILTDNGVFGQEEAADVD